MRRSGPLLLTFALCFGGACATAPSAPPVSPEGRVGGLAVDPRLGWADREGEARARRDLDAALAELAAGREPRARERLLALERRAPSYPPASLALAALDLGRGDLDAAAPRIEAAATARDSWAAAEFYRAELLARRGEIRQALAELRELARQPGAPRAVEDRVRALETQLFDRLYREAIELEGPPAFAALREAVALRPDSTPARLLLVQKLIAAGRTADARMEIDPILRTADADRPEVQAALAEIDAARRRYEDAIARYERIVRTDPRAEFTRRLDELKREFALANMPRRYVAAMGSGALTRSELAILTYWTVSAVRFGRLPAHPPIAVDVADAPGRDELVRAIGFGLLAVDPATRRVDPDRTMTAASVARFLFRLLSIRGVAPCAEAAGGEGGELARAVRALRACGVDAELALVDPDAPVDAATALRALQRIDAILSTE